MKIPMLYLFKCKKIVAIVHHRNWSIEWVNPETKEQHWGSSGYETHVTFKAMDEAEALEMLAEAEKSLQVNIFSFALDGEREIAAHLTGILVMSGFTKVGLEIRVRQRDTASTTTTRDE